MNEANSAARGRRMNRTDNSPESSCAPLKGVNSNRHLDEITVTGWRQSKAASNPGGGIREVINFLERKATKDERDKVRVIKSRTDGDSLIVSVKPQDTPKILRLNTYAFAGAKLAIQEHSSTPSPPAASNISESTKQLKVEIANFLNRRYDTELKMLDLSALRSAEPEFTATGMFETQEKTSKFFAAIMVVCEETFKTNQERREAVVSIRLANNELPHLRSVSTLTTTFPDLKNLDLSNNNLQDLDPVCMWRPRLRHLEHLVLSGNPLETKFANYEDAVFKRIPQLQMLNGKQRPVKNATGSATSKPKHVIAPKVTSNSPSLGWDVLENICKPEGWGFPVEGKTEEHMRKEQAAFQLSMETHMTLEFSAQCLEENGWDLKQAYDKFMMVKDSIPPHGWMKTDKEGRRVGCKAVEESILAQGYLA